MRKIELKYRKLLRTLFGCVSLTAVAFVFQACYGTKPDWYYDVKLTGMVRSKTTNLPIKGIKIAVNENERAGYGYSNSGFTDENGKFEFYASVPNEHYPPMFVDSTGTSCYTYDSVYVRFIDIDGIENGLFEEKTIIIAPAHKKEVRINVELNQK